MIVSARLGYLYACPGKTGSLSVRRWLIDHYYGQPVGKYHSTTVPDEFKDNFKFITVRNPYERLYSLWHYVDNSGYSKFKDGWDFMRLCDWEASGGRSLCDFYDIVGAQAALKVENIQQEIKGLPFFKSDRPVPGHARRGAHKPTSSFFNQFDHYSAEAVAVRTLFADDFKRFGYQP